MDSSNLDFNSASTDPDALVAQASALLAGVDDPVANAANLSSLLYHALEEVNWVGFYFLKNGGLIVGPFQGKPACVAIPMGRGVCGTAAASRQVIRVNDVHQFDGHIACDAASRSEIVLPLIKNGELIGVLDIDSPVQGRFSERDEELLVRVVEVYIDSMAPAPTPG
jgi:GAF domain-containing protein